MAKQKKKDYYSKKIDNANGNVRAIYNVVNRELDKVKSSPLPDYDDTERLAREFNNFFLQKINNIRKEFPNITSQIQHDEAINDQNCLYEFVPTTVTEIKEIILSEAGVNCSPSDFLPSDVLKEHIEVFAPTLCKLVNLSLSTGSMEGLKVADIIPTIKGDQLDANTFKNYRPISNLTYLGKLIERVVLKRLNNHMDQNNLHKSAQSGYKKHHSTETILLKITNDVLIAADDKSATVLMLLDLSAAFDTVDHNKLLSILKHEIGLRSTVLKWFSSFLQGRSQRIRLGHVLSEDIVIKFGVPQGSVLGPVLFNIYVRSLYHRIEKTGFLVQGYADDHQVYRHFRDYEQGKVLTSELQFCLDDIKRWMVEYCLQLNPGKTQIMVLGPNHVVTNIDINGIQLSNGDCIRFTSSTKNLGFIFDRNLSFSEQIKSVKKHCFKLLRQIRKLRFIFTQDQVKLIVNSLVVCKLDYCNALYWGITDKNLRQLQLIQNAAAKAVMGLYKHDSLGNTLSQLHWLPVHHRIVFKILLIVYKSLNSKAPGYLQNMFQYKCVNTTPVLVEPRVKTSCGDRAFQNIGPRLWNSLPINIKTSGTLDTFKTSLKTHLFNEAFGNDC